MKFHSVALLPFFASLALANENTYIWDVMAVKLPEPISDMTATAGPDGLIYIAGGCNSTLGNVFDNSSGFFNCLSSTDAFHSFNPKTSKFTSLPTLPRPRYRHGAAVSKNHLWLIGGRSIEDSVIMEIDIYNFDTQKWSTPGNHTQGVGDNAAFGSDDYAYVVGGWNASYAAVANVWRMHMNDAGTLTIEEVAPLQEARGDIRAVTDDKGQAYVVSGFTDAQCQALSTAEKFDMASGTWTYLDNVEYPGGDKALVELNFRVFTIGGEVQASCTDLVDPPDPGEGTVVTDDVEVLDDSGAWTTIASIPNARFRFDAEAANGQVFVFGGQNAFNKTCECYSTSDEILFLSEVPSAQGGGGKATGASGAHYSSIVSAFMCIAIGMAGIA